MKRIVPNCTDTSYLCVLFSILECQAAADTLGLTYNSLPSLFDPAFSVSNEYPFGCYVAVEKAYLWFNPTGVKGYGGTSRRSICKAQEGSPQGGDMNAVCSGGSQLDGYGDCLCRPGLVCQSVTTQGQCRTATFSHDGSTAHYWMPGTCSDCVCYDSDGCQGGSRWENGRCTCLNDVCEGSRCQTESFTQNNVSATNHFWQLGSCTDCICVDTNGCNGGSYLDGDGDCSCRVGSVCDGPRCRQAQFSDGILVDYWAAGDCDSCSCHGNTTYISTICGDGAFFVDGDCACIGGEACIGSHCRLGVWTDTGNTAHWWQSGICSDCQCAPPICGGQSATAYFGWDDTDCVCEPGLICVDASDDNGCNAYYTMEGTPIPYWPANHCPNCACDLPAPSNINAAVRLGGIVPWSGRLELAIAGAQGIS